MSAKFSEVVVVNNTRMELPTSWWVAAIDSLKSTGSLPEDLADLFVVHSIEVADGTRFILDAA
jgi:hypothetical protein